jgi:hypothetical protein
MEWVDPRVAVKGYSRKLDGPDFFEVGVNTLYLHEHKSTVNMRSQRSFG